MAKWIEDYALIGDCETAALVGLDGSIDWLCWPRFDSDACFAALLGTPEHGRWLLTPCAADAKVTRRYRENTLILETRFETPEGCVCVIDFMPPRDLRSDLVRIVVGERGQVAMRTELVIRFGYGTAVPWVTHIADDTWRAIAGPDMLTLRTPAQMRGENLKSVADFVVREGESVPFVLRYSPSHLPDIELTEAQQALASTERFWREWVEKGQRIAKWSDAVTRSLITLRAAASSPRRRHRYPSASAARAIGTIDSAGCAMRR